MKKKGKNKKYNLIIFNLFFVIGDLIKYNPK